MVVHGTVLYDYFTNKVEQDLYHIWNDFLQHGAATLFINIGVLKFLP